MSEGLADNGSQTKFTDAGFLVNRDDWCESLAVEIARLLSVRLTDAHWEIIYFIRDYYERFDHLPNARVFTKAVRTQLGEDKGNSRYLYRLFPDGPLKSVCRIAGLPKPTSCI